MRSRRFPLAAAAVVLALAAAPVAVVGDEAPPAGGGATPPPPAAPVPPAAPAPPAAPRGIVKIDIVEKVAGAESKENLAAYFIRKKLREAGFVAWSARPIRADQLEKKPARPMPGSAPGAAGAPPSPVPPANPASETPAPDLVVRGTVDIVKGKVSIFYGRVVATAYEGHVKLEIADGAGTVLAKVEDWDEWGKTKEDVARSESLQRTALFAAAGVLASEPIRSRADERTKEKIDAFVKGLESKRRKAKDPDEPEGASDPEPLPPDGDGTPNGKDRS